MQAGYHAPCVITNKFKPDEIGEDELFCEIFESDWVGFELEINGYADQRKLIYLVTCKNPDVEVLCGDELLVDTWMLPRDGGICLINNSQTALFKR